MLHSPFWQRPKTWNWEQCFVFFSHTNFWSTEFHFRMIIFFVGAEVSVGKICFSCPGLAIICFQSVTLEHAHVRVCASVSSVFIIDIADKLLGSDWTCLMSCRCESQQMKMGFCICMTAETPDRWRQMGSVSYCLASIHSRSHAFSHTHPRLSATLWQNFQVKHHKIFYLSPNSCLWGQGSVIQQLIAIHSTV